MKMMMILSIPKNRRKHIPNLRGPSMNISSRMFIAEIINTSSRLRLKMMLGPCLHSHHHLHNCTAFFRLFAVTESAGLLVSWTSVQNVLGRENGYTRNQRTLEVRHSGTERGIKANGDPGGRFPTQSRVYYSAWSCMNTFNVSPESFTLANVGNLRALHKRRTQSRMGPTPGILRSSVPPKYPIALFYQLIIIDFTKILESQQKSAQDAG